MPAGSISGKLNLNAAGWSSAVEKAKKEIKSLQDASKDAGHGTVSSMQAASASIRLIEGDMTRNVRAVEKFITTIPGVGKALQAAFPLVGGAAFAGILFRIGEEAANAIKKVQLAPQAISNAFREINQGAELSVDSLNLSTAKMQEQIALLTGKKPNTLAIDLAEAAVAADKLAISLDNDNKKIAALLKENGLSALSGLIGKAGTAEVAGSINSFDQQISDLSARRQHAVRSGDTAGAANLLKQLDDKRAAAEAYANAQISARQNQGVGGLNQDANVAILTGFRNTLVDQADSEQSEKANTATAGQLKKIQDAQKYAELQKKAQQELMRVFQEQEKQQNAFNKLTINEEIKFWSDRIGAFTRGGEQYIAVQDKIYDLIARRPDLTKTNKENQARSGKSEVEGADLLSAGASALNKFQLEQDEGRSKAAEKYNQIVNAGNIEQEKAASAFAEMSIGIALAQGSISRLDAAQALAAVHADDHAKALQRVNDELATQIGLINSDPKLTTDQKGDAIRNAQAAAANQVGAINAGYAQQRVGDRADISDSTISGAVKQALDRMVQSFTDMAGQLKSTIPRLIDGLNDNIAKVATGQGHRGDFGRTFLGAGEGLIKSGLQGVEGKLLGAFGLGKTTPGSSPGNPIYTIDVSAGKLGTPSGILGSAISHIPGVGGGAIPNFLMSLAPHFAEGGDFIGNSPMIVGERGPELLMPSASGRVIPNHALGGMDTHTHFHIDARGSNDPAAVHAAVMRAAPHIVAASAKVQHQAAKRSPGGR